MLLEAGGYFGLVLLSENPYLKNFINTLERKRVLSIMSTLGLPTTTTTSASSSASSSASASTSTVNQLDVDVLSEKTRIEATDPDVTDDMLFINGLMKTYPPSLLCGGLIKRAVRGISLGCKRNEIFGLLGINGAGKVMLLTVLLYSVYSVLYIYMYICMNFKYI